MNNLNIFKNQNIVIVGGYRGMGYELAKNILENKGNLFLIGKNSKNEEIVKKKLNTYKDNIVLGTADLNLEENVEKICEKINIWCSGKLHHLVIMLGSGKTPFGYNFTIKHWIDVMNKNLFTPILMINKLCDLMFHCENNPSITFTGAIAGVERVTAPMTYSISKTALISYSNHLAKEFVDKGVRVNTVSPGNIYFKGGRWEEIISEKGQDEINKYINDSVGMKRFGTAEELAYIYFQIMSTNNSFMTGQNIIVDGMQTNRLF